MRRFANKFSSRFSRLRNLLFIRTIEGWVTKEDKALIKSILVFQREFNISGHILEIGVYKGGLIPVYASQTCKGESLFLCDLFDTKEASEENLNEIESSYQPIDVENILRILESFPDVAAHIIIGNSLSLPPVIEKFRFRFVHIDGSHLYEVVQQDIAIAMKILDPESGVLVIDDYRTLHTPDVSRAVWELISTSHVKVLFRTSAKIYLAKKSSKISCDAIFQYLSPSIENEQIIQKRNLEGMIILNSNEDIYRKTLLDRLASKTARLVLLFFWKDQKSSRNVNLIKV
jgi:hypothetical protein